MSYKKTLDYMYAQLPMYHRIGASAYKANLDNTIALCKILNNPQKSFRSVHISGTNGKGSVAHMLASVLQTANYRTGLYTSPHLRDFRERIRVNGKMIPRSYVSSFIKKYQDQFEKFQPSFFELTVGMAFNYFRDQQVDIAVVEVGLGGRLDSTNIITPVVSAITNVSMDHMQFLGNTLNKIATEKAGIIKPGIPVVIGETQKETKKVFLEKASSCDSEILFADQLFSVSSGGSYHDSAKKRIFDIEMKGSPFMNKVVLPLPGLYQRKNLVTVMGICSVLEKKGYSLTQQEIRDGLRNVIVNTGFAGRWQVLGQDPLVICDTGHNEGGIKEVVAQLAITPHKQLHCVIGFVNDKRLEPILEQLPLKGIYYYCKPNVPRGLDVKVLQKAATDSGLRGTAYPSVKDAIKAAIANADKNDLVFIGGSNFVVAEAV